MLKRFELDGVTRRIEEEHGGLFARLAFEADVWLDDEFGARGLKALGEFVPLLHRQHDTEVAAGDVVTVDLGSLRHRAFFRRKMRDDLMTVEIKVHPVWAGAAFFAAEQVKIELASGGEIVSGEG